MTSQKSLSINTTRPRKAKKIIEKLSILVDSGISITLRKIMDRLKVDEKTAIKILRNEFIRADSKAELS